MLIYRFHLQLFNKSTFTIAYFTQRIHSFKEARRPCKMDIKQLERYFHGYILVPCCPEDYCHNQLESLTSLQEIPSPYTGSILKYDPVLPEHNEKQPAHASRNTSHERESGCARRVVFPAIYRQRPTECGVSRHEIDEERPFALSSLRGT